MFKLGKIIVDGEGAKKFITIKVHNAKSITSAKKLLFDCKFTSGKTAIAGEDPNWGRIIMGIGKSGERVDPHKRISSLVNFSAENGKVSNSYDEKKLQEYMKDSILIDVDLNLGHEKFECYTCDLPMIILILIQTIEILLENYKKIINY